MSVTTAPGAPAPRRLSAAEHLRSWPLMIVRLGPALVLIAISLVFAAINPIFLDWDNLLDVGVQASPIAILALGQLMVVLTRGIDLSVGSTIALSMVVGWAAWGSGDQSAVLVIVAFLLVGFTVGLLNGLVFVKGRVPHPFIVTLGSLNVVAGLALVISKGEPKTGMPQAIVDLGSAELGGIPVPIIVTAVMALVASFFLRHVAWGRWIYAAGGNPEGAVRAGIPYPRVIISVYVLSGIAAAIASILIAGRTASAYPTAGLQAELDAIAAVIIGGASFFGGRGTVSSAVVGALIIAAVRNGLNLAQIRPDWQQVAIGAIVVGAVLLDVWRGQLEVSARQRRARLVEHEVAA
jgi:ribose transport system permease protein